MAFDAPAPSTQGSNEPSHLQYKITPVLLIGKPGWVGLYHSSGKLAQSGLVWSISFGLCHILSLCHYDAVTLMSDTAKLQVTVYTAQTTPYGV